VDALARARRHKAKGGMFADREFYVTSNVKKEVYDDLLRAVVAAGGGKVRLLLAVYYTKYY
jgi:hypothetical protein